MFKPVFRKPILSILLLGCLSIHLCSFVLAAEKVIKEIRISGNSAIVNETILFLIKSKVGEPVEALKIREDLKSIYGSGFFEDVTVERNEEVDGIILTYKVVEKPILKSYQITGNKKITVSTLQEALDEKAKITLPTVYDPVKINMAAQTLRAKYIENGYNYVTVTPIVKDIGPKNVSIIFAVNEGQKVRITSISFEGAQEAKPGNRFWGMRHALKDTREHWFMSWLTGGGKYTQEKMQEDLGKLQEYLNNKGFAKAATGEPKVDIKEVQYGRKKAKSRKLASIVIPIYEGNVYRFGDLSVSGNELYKNDVLLKVIGGTKKTGMFDTSVLFNREKRLKTGERYNGSLVKSVIESMTELYGSQGYIYSNIVPETTYNETTQTVDLQFHIREGMQTRLRRMEFKGNNRTRDKVLRRQFYLMEGDIFDTIAFKNGISRLNYLGYIKDVVPDVQPLPDDPSKIDVTVGVNDEHQTEIQLSGGYSSVDKVFGMISLSEHNLFGRGQELNFSVSSSKIRKTFQIRFSDEYLFDTNHYGSVGVWNTYKNYPSAKYKTIGANVAVGKPLFRNLYGRVGYTYQIDNLYDLDEDDEEDNEDDSSYYWEDEEDDYLESQKGKSHTSSVTWTFTRDMRDNRREPTNGTYANLAIEYAGGVLQGDNSFYRYELELSYYKLLGRNVVWLVHSEFDYAAGYNDEDLPYFKRYFLGGAQTVRGYGQNSIGPKNSSGVNVGGNKAIVFNTELIIPIAGPLKVVLFADAGDAYRSDVAYDLKTLRPSAGMELRFYVPSFWVPFRFIWGYKLDRYEDESLTDFQFTLGTYY